MSPERPLTYTLSLVARGALTSNSDEQLILRDGSPTVDDSVLVEAGRR